MRLLMLIFIASTALATARAGDHPNVILVMTDDQGFADAGFQGHPVLRTPHLDALAARGMILERFYSQSPVCSPTRASCLTGLHPQRLGITGANAGHMPEEVWTLAEILRDEGYATGHFGKWHLGTLTRDVQDSNRGGRPSHDRHYAPPWAHGFDECFSTEAKVPTTDPMVHPDTGERYGTRYWTGPGEIVTENLDGDDARVIVDRAVPFIESCAESGTPFLAVVWFHAPHLPLVAPPDFADRYAGEANATYLATLSGIDQQVGRIWETLEAAGVADNTMLWFCSDNGPESRGGEDRTAGAHEFVNHPYGSAAPLRGRKRMLLEGGVRSPAFVVWPGRVREGSRGKGVACTTDYTPTILDALGIEHPRPTREFDGVSVLPMIEGDVWSRPSPLRLLAGRQRAIVQWPHKLVTTDDESFALYDLDEDPGETRDLSAQLPDIAASLRSDVDAWAQSVEQERANRPHE